MKAGALDETSLQLSSYHSLVSVFLGRSRVGDAARGCGEIFEIDDVTLQRQDMFHADRADCMASDWAGCLARFRDAASFPIGRWDDVVRIGDVFEGHALRVEALRVAHTSKLSGIVPFTNGARAIPHLAAEAAISRRRSSSAVLELSRSCR